jgi:hypothetical protein
MIPRIAGAAKPSIRRGLLRKLSTRIGGTRRSKPRLTGLGLSANSDLGIEPLAQLLAGLEEGNVLLRNLHAGASTRVAADAGLAAFHRKSAEAPQFYPITAREGGRDLIENCSDDALDVALIEVRIDLSESLDEF